MCLNSRLMLNPKYKKNKKNKGRPPLISDHRVMYVPIKCNKCMECQKQKSNNWRTRLLEDIKTNREATFVTLTFSKESLNKFKKSALNGLHVMHIMKKRKRHYYVKKQRKILLGSMSLKGYELDNWIATKATRMFLERWRKEHKTSLRHWLITELGHSGTERVHLHGIVWSKNTEKIKAHWGYGWVWCGTYVNEATVNYIVKYVTKQDADHKFYNPIVLTSPGIGANYVNSYGAQSNKYNENGETNETYRTREGHRVNLPLYYRNKIYTEEEREKLWLQKLDKNERWVDGVKCTTQEEYFRALQTAKAKALRMGYRDDKDWQRQEYEEQLRELKNKKNNSA